MQPQNQFEELVIQVCNEIAETVILKNREYGNSYEKLRKEAKEVLGNEKAPLWIYQTVKRNRYMETGKADTRIDGAGHWVLEEVCCRIEEGV